MGGLLRFLSDAAWALIWLAVLLAALYIVVGFLSRRKGLVGMAGKRVESAITPPAA